jgi:hypothetical protein
LVEARVTLFSIDLCLRLTDLLLGEESLGFDFLEELQLWSAGSKMTHVISPFAEQH